MGQLIPCNLLHNLAYIYSVYIVHHLSSHNFKLNGNFTVKHSSVRDQLEIRIFLQVEEDDDQDGHLEDNPLPLIAAAELRCLLSSQHMNEHAGARSIVRLALIQTGVILRSCLQDQRHCGYL